MLTPKGAGNKQSSFRSHREYNKPKDIVVDAFEEWVAKSNEAYRIKGRIYDKEAYESALEICKKYELIKEKPEDINPISMLFHEVKNKDVYALTGYFLAACHNLIEDNIITLKNYCLVRHNEHNNKIKGVGYQLPENKTLIIHSGNELNVAGESSKGTIISYADTDFLGVHAKAGLVINKNKTKSLAGFSDCTAINCSEANVIGSNAETVLAVKNPAKELRRDARVVFDEDECKKLPFYDKLEELVKAEPDKVIDVINDLKPYLDKI